MTRKFTYIWSVLAMVIVGAETVNAAQQNATVLWENTVCMTLPVFILCLLLPAEDIVTIVARRLDAAGATQKE